MMAVVSSALFNIVATGHPLAVEHWNVANATEWLTVLFCFILINLIVYLNSRIWLVVTWLDSTAVHRGCVAGGTGHVSLASWLGHARFQAFCSCVGLLQEHRAATEHSPRGHQRCYTRSCSPAFFSGDTQLEGQVVFLSVTTGKSWMLKAIA